MVRPRMEAGWGMGGRMRYLGFGGKVSPPSPPVPRPLSAPSPSPFPAPAPAALPGPAAAPRMDASTGIVTAPVWTGSSIFWTLDGMATAGGISLGTGGRVSARGLAGRSIRTNVTPPPPPFHPDAPGERGSDTMGALSS